VRTSVTRCFEFEAAHRLPWHAGKCSRAHGHSYRLEVTVEGRVGEQGVVIDFADLSAAVHRDVIERLDHRDLNELMPNPTAELIAQDIWERLDVAGVQVTRLRLWETSDASVELTR
jgi:6-pyruvoyltetrahydropterin/6-carboxytetrahydropterin synthase